MAFSYSGNPGANTLDEIRFMTGDVNESLSLLSDEEAQWLVTQYVTPSAALVHALRLMLIKTMHDTIIEVDGIKRDLSSRNAALQARLDEALILSAALAPPFLGGVSVAGRDTRRTDSDLIQPVFSVSTPEESA